MLSVAWVTPFPPDHDGGGGQIRQAHLLTALAAHAAVHLISPGPVADPAIQAAAAQVTTTADPVGWRGAHRWRRRASDLLAMVASRRPIEVRAFGPVRRGLRKALAGVEAGGPFDVVLVEFAGLAPLLPRRRSGRWVLTLHNLPSRMAAQQAAVMPHRRQRWLLERDARIARRFERRLAARFDAVIVTTPEDAAALGAADPILAARITVVPNGTDVDRLRPSPLPAAARIVFTGALYTTPNVDGVTWFCREIFPRIRESDPTAELAIVGARPSAAVRALSAWPGVTVAADVAAVGPFLAAARVAVVPIRIGSGSRLKAMEALAAGRPVVGTTAGLEGLGLRAGVEALVADDPAEFAAAVGRLLRDDDLASSQARAGRAAAEQRFGWPTIGATFAETIEGLAERTP